MLSKARDYILRSTGITLHDLVPTDLIARVVLRYWRLRRRGQTALRVLARHRRRPSVTLAGHALVLALGFVIVVPALSVRSAPSRAIAAQYSGYVMWTSQAHVRNATEIREVAKASALEERPAPAVIDQAAAIATRVTARPLQAPAAFTPPPGSGGDGLAAINSVFGNSPGLSWALRVAYCESRYNPLAINRSSGASGLFQFMPSTWNANFPGQNIWDPYAQARGALVFYNAGRQSAWTCK
jgi:hypothetical protein